jgi:hypothetical protein
MLTYFSIVFSETTRTISQRAQHTEIEAHLRLTERCNYFYDDLNLALCGSHTLWKSP